MNANIRPALLAGFCLAAALPAPSAAATTGFVFTKIAESGMAKPGGGTFTLNESVTAPATNGASVVFLNHPNGIADSLWSARLDGTGLRALADQSTPVPDGIGNFTRFGLYGPPLAKGASVVFSGSDASGRGYPDYGGGLYSVPARGGPVARVVNYATAAVGGKGNFASFGSTSGRPTFATDGKQVAFEGLDADFQGGIFAAGLDGSALVPVAVSFGGRKCPNELSPGLFDLNSFTRPSVSQGRASYYASGLFDPSTGANQALTAPSASYGGDTCNVIGSSLTPLPADPNLGQSHTRYGDIQLDRGIVVLAADYSQPFDAGFNNLRGLYAVCADGSSGQNTADGKPAKPTCRLPKRASATDSPFARVVDSFSSLPGLSEALNPHSSFAYSLNGGQVLFRAVDRAAPAHEGLYLADLGHLSADKVRVIGSGDTLDGRQIVRFGNPSMGALGGSSLAFTAVLANGAVAVYSAQRLPCAADVSAAVTATAGRAKLDPATGEYTQTVTLTNTGAQAVAGPVWLVLRDVSANATLSNAAGHTACLAPEDAPYLRAKLKDGSLAAGASVKLALRFAKPGQGAITYTAGVGAGGAP